MRLLLRLPFGFLGLAYALQLRGDNERTVEAREGIFGGLGLFGGLVLGRGFGLCGGFGREEGAEEGHGGGGVGGERDVVGFGQLVDEGRV